MDLLNIVEESFKTYAGMTIQDRAIVDARDCLKPSQRQCMYAQYLEGITYKKPFKKSNKSVAAAMDKFYVHGDASCYSLLTRMAKPFVMNYPLIDFDGSCGTVTSNNSEASSRYTEMRLGELGSLLYKDIEKECISNWFDNYDNTDKYPMVVPSLGYYNIVNGTSGIATGLSSSIPQYNLKEVNEAMIKLLWNPEINFEEIYCPPDFCTGGVILNSEEIKESIKNGQGKSILLRSRVDFDEKQNCLYITEIPYNVYTNTIIQQIKTLIEEEKLVGIKKVDDLSTKQAKIKILLEKNINVSRMIRELYKNTSIQEYYPIHMMMLDKGKYPKIFGWKMALEAHLEHEKEVRTKIHEYEIKRIDKRINIIEGIIKVILNIEKTVEIIKNSSDKENAKNNLIKAFELNEEQAENIMKITLSKLTSLQKEIFLNEKEDLLKERIEHNNILNDEKLLYKEIEMDLRRVSEKFGDNRKTELMNLQMVGGEENFEPIEKRELLIYFTNFNNIYTYDSSTLCLQKRGQVGKKLKLQENENIVKALNSNNFNSILAFSNKGRMYSIFVDELPTNSKVNLFSLINLEQDERITETMIFEKDTPYKYFLFVTKQGLIKKTEIEEYRTRYKSIKAILLNDEDEVVSVYPINEDKIALLSKNGKFIKIKTEEISAIGRNSKGVIGIRLEDNDEIIDSKIIIGDKIIVVSKKGMIKKIDLNEYPYHNRGGKGIRISGVKKDDSIIKFLTFNEDCEVIIVSNSGMIKINTQEINMLSRNAVGVRAMKIPENIEVIDILKNNS